MFCHGITTATQLLKSRTQGKGNNMKKYIVNVYKIDHNYDIEAKNKKEAIEEAQDRYISFPLYDCNEPVKFEVEEVDEERESVRQGKFGCAGTNQ